MRLNYDLIRDIMLKVEFEADGSANISPKKLAEAYFSNYDLDVVLYHIKYIRDSEMIEPKSGPEFIDLTPKGHEFLNTIRDDTVWKKTKKKVQSCLDSASLTLLAKVAETIASSFLGL